MGTFPEDILEGESKTVDFDLLIQKYQILNYNTKTRVPMKRLGAPQ